MLLESGLGDVGGEEGGGRRRRLSWEDCGVEALAD